jgi:hypothetical protein
MAAHTRRVAIRGRPRWRGCVGRRDCLFRCRRAQASRRIAHAGHRWARASYLAGRRRARLPCLGPWSARGGHRCVRRGRGRAGDRGPARREVTAAAELQDRNPRLFVRARWCDPRVSPRWVAGRQIGWDAAHRHPSDSPRCHAKPIDPATLYDVLTGRRSRHNGDIERHVLRVPADARIARPHRPR